MALRVRPVSRLELMVRAKHPDTLAPIGGLPAYVDVHRSNTDAWARARGVEVPARGCESVSVTAPVVAGVYRYRSRAPGLVGRYRADVSATLPIEVVEPGA